MRIPAAVAILFAPIAIAASATPQPPRLLDARFTGGCDAYTIAVTGEGFNQPNAMVSYNITLTLPSGEAMTITDSFAVLPEKDGSFHQTVHESWKKFEFTLTGKYVLSGSAILLSDLTFLHMRKMKFARTRLNCSGRP